MSDLKESLALILADAPVRLILSKPVQKTQDDRKVVKVVKVVIEAITEKNNHYFQISKYTQKQVFHENCDGEALLAYLLDTMGTQFLQLNGWSAGREHQILMSKKGTVTYKKKVVPLAAQPKQPTGHNRQKHYLLQEGSQIPPLIDMGIFTKEGKVVHAMYDKFRQINRFIELIDDAVGTVNKPCWHIIDFGCGKSYLTFILYYYFT